MARTRERERRAHKPLSSAALKKREDQQGGMFDSLCKEDYKTFRPKPGQNNVRFFEGTWPKAEHWAHDTWIHNQIGPDNGRYFCLQKMLNQPCPLCDERRALMAASETEAAKAITPRKGACAWVINRDDEEAGPLLWFYGRTVDEEFAGRCRDRKTGEPIDIIHPDEGNDVFFKMTKKGKEASNVEYSAYEIDRDPTPIHDKEKVQNRWLDYVEENPVPDCFNYYDAEYLKNLITGAQMSKAADDDDEEEERPRGKRRSIDDDDDEDEKPKKRSRSRAEDDDDEPPPRRRVVKDEEEDDDEPPSRRRRVRDEDEEEDDDEPPSRRRRVRDEDEEEDEGVSSRRTRKNNRDEDDADDEPPRRRVRSKDDDAEDDEDEPASKRKRSKLSEDLDDEIPDMRPKRTRGKAEDEPAPKRKRARLADDDDGEDVVEQAKRQLKRLKEEEDADEEEDEPPRKKRR